ncbi:MAG: hypothetical protein C0606_09485 [Hyphomicrobiales bacterium]|nr:MAG: hypothetical protein C0606_09485 [Hyphomicrobiales bacterium]
MTDTHVVRRHDTDRRHSPFVRDQRGSVAIIFTFLLIPAMALIGAMLDFSMSIRARSHLQAATDAAALATAKYIASGESEPELLGRKSFDANFIAGDGVGSPSVQISTNSAEKTVTVTASASLSTLVLGIVGVEEIEIAAQSDAAVGGRALEVALVLDNTGSMRNDMSALRSAAGDLADDLFALAPQGNPEMVKVAVVPYVGTVNVGDNFPTSNLDTNGDSSVHGIFFEDYPVAKKSDYSCRYAHYSRMFEPETRQTLRTLAYVFEELVGIPSAAAVAGALPDDHTLDGCFVITPAKVNHMNLFSTFSQTDWKGCVEARPEPYDVNDTTPIFGNADTLFVPFFWPDETDRFTYSIRARNSYMSDDVYIDDTSGGTYTGHKSSIEYLWRSVLKYTSGKTSTIKEHNNDGSSTSGPNKGCPDPVQPLTTSKTAVQSTISNMTYWPSSGTIISEGLMWGWRVLSPGAPFTEGRPYEDKVSKVLVLMTDGNNELISNDSDGPTVSDYSAYGYIKGGHFPSNVDTIYEGKNYLDGRLSQACSNAKAAGITIYTVAFDVSSSSTRNLLKGCATADSHYFDAQSTSDLAAAFQQIGRDITELRLTK